MFHALRSASSVVVAVNAKSFSLRANMGNGAVHGNVKGVGTKHLGMPWRNRDRDHHRNPSTETR